MKNPPFEPDPDAWSQPGIATCRVLPNLDSVAECKRPWDRTHTVLGHAICAGCFEAIRVP